MELLLATSNPKKQDELRRILARMPIEVLVPDEIGGIPEVLEDAPSFRANAAKKAISAARASRRWALADDSGLEVDHLNGEPGVRSARFAGEECDDAANNQLLLERLKGVSEGQRGARFVCALALARPDGELAAQIEGQARGQILEAPRGAGDFGYDPLFLFSEAGFPETGRGFAELSPEAKARVSHRGRALNSLKKALVELLSE